VLGQLLDQQLWHLLEHGLEVVVGESRVSRENAAAKVHGQLDVV